MDNNYNFIVGFDIDGTTINTYKILKKHIQIDFKCLLSGVNWVIPNKTNDEIGDIINDYINKYSYEMDIHQDTLSLINKLIIRKIEFKFVSCRPLVMQKFTENYLKNKFKSHNIDISKVDIICSGTKANKLNNSKDCKYFYEDTEMFSKYLSENNLDIIVFQIDRKNGQLIQKIRNNYYIINSMLNSCDVIF